MTVNMKKYNFAIREWLGGDDWPEGFFIHDRDNEVYLLRNGECHRNNIQLSWKMFFFEDNEVYDAVDNYLNDIPFDITNKRYLTLDEIVDDC